MDGLLPTVYCYISLIFVQVTPWLTSLGYSLCFGTIIAKMSRVFYIFNNPTLNKKLVG